MDPKQELIRYAIPATVMVLAVVHAVHDRFIYGSVLAVVAAMTVVAERRRPAPLLWLAAGLVALLAAIFLL